MAIGGLKWYNKYITQILKEVNMKSFYNTTYKRRAIELIKQFKSPTFVARTLGIPKKTLEKWITKYKLDEEAFEIGYIPDSIKLRELEIENKKLINTIEMLKKALAFLLCKK